MSKHCYF